MRRELDAAWRLGVAGLLAAALLAGVWALTRERIAEEERRVELLAMAMVLPPALYDNDPLGDTLRVCAGDDLGPGAHTVYRARRGGEPVALAITATAPDGYSGRIELLIGLDIDGRVLGVRVVRHRETPGLGDAIEAEKSDWIERFHGLFLGEPPVERWKVRRDGGDFDQFAGATVSPRAVVGALRRALEFHAREGGRLFAEDAPAELRCATPIPM
ncbi:MAG TPA: electron transport complex subunit RsxG [Xanthomonadaceae bacterium]|nr:electron transport complex subunit RsxG [Xanthomonadaceae bacterium]